MDPDIQLLYTSIATIIGLIVVFLLGTYISSGIYIAGWILGFFTAVSLSIYVVSKNTVVYNVKNEPIRRR
jgi:hypothetical protein